MEYSEELGKLTVCRVYGNWTKSNLGRLPHLSFGKRVRAHPHPRFQEEQRGHLAHHERGRADLSVSAHLQGRAHNGRRGLPSAPLHAQAQRQGIHIICNSANASEELLSLADSFKDYREIIPGEAAEAAEEAVEAERCATAGRGGNPKAEDRGKVRKRKRAGAVDLAYRFLVEAVQEW
jgi:hypothetical protein